MITTQINIYILNQIPKKYCIRPKTIYIYIRTFFMHEYRNDAAVPAFAVDKTQTHTK